MNLMKECRAIGRHLKKPQISPRIPRDIVDYNMTMRDRSGSGSTTGLGKFRAKGNGR